MKYSKALIHYTNPRFLSLIRTAIENGIVKKDTIPNRLCNCRVKGKDGRICPVLKLYRFVTYERGESYDDDDMCGDFENKFFTLFDQRYDSCTATREVLDAVLQAYQDTKKRTVRI